eukprot:TCONS_00037769-protein
MCLKVCLHLSLLAMMLFSKQTTCGLLKTDTSLPKHENIFITIDLGHEHKELAESILTQLLDGINLLEYRIAVYTTYGVEKRIVDFQSRECTIKNIVSTIKSKRTLTKREVLKTMLRESAQYKTNQNTLTIITDDDLVSRRYHYVIRIPDDVTSRQEIDKSMLHKFHFYNAELKKCDVVGPRITILDECNRECSCQDGHLTNCYRVRRQFSELPLKDRLHYIKAYKTLFTHQPFNETFLNLLDIHPFLKFRLLHGKDQILPFHRKYLLVVENMFRLLDCRLTIPYWNFPRFSQTLYQPSHNYHIWDNVGGFGSTESKIENGFCINEGEFAYPGWTLPSSRISGFMNNQTLVRWVCNLKYGYSSWLEQNCSEKLKKTLNRRCISRAVNTDKDFKVVTLKNAYDLTMKSDVDDFDEYLQKMIFEVHSPIHDKLGKY